MDYSLKNDVDGRDSFYVPRYEVKEIFFVIKQIGFVGLLSELIIYVCRYLFSSPTDKTVPDPEKVHSHYLGAFPSPWPLLSHQGSS